MASFLGPNIMCQTGEDIFNYGWEIKVFVKRITHAQTGCFIISRPGPTSRQEMKVAVGPKQD